MIEPDTSSESPEPASPSMAIPMPAPTLARWWAFWLFFAIALYTPLIDVAPGQGNVQSDLAAIESLVVRQTFFINDSPFADTIDKFRREDGRFFSQKSPIFHLAAALPALALERVGYSFVERRPLFQRVLTFFMVILPMGWLLGLVFTHPWLRRRPLRDRLALTLFFALGSLLTPFAVTLNHYTLAAATLFCAVRLLSRASAGEPAPSPRRLGLGVGFWVAASMACDVPPAFLFGAGVGCVFLFQPGRARLAWMAAGAAPLLLLYAALNLHIIGSPFPPNMHESTMLYYEGSYWSELKAQADAGHPGYYQASYPRRLYHATLGHKGIFWMWPLLTLALFAVAQLARQRAPGWRLALAWALFPFITIAITMRWAFDLSGGAYGIRHAFAALPPLFCVLCHPALRPGRGVRALAGLLGLWGVLVAAFGLLNPWSHNTLSAYPPLENLARTALRHADRFPTHWIGSVIDRSALDPANAWLDLGLARLEQQQLRAAESALRRAILVQPDLALPYYHLGIVLDMQRRPHDAIAAYRTLLRLEPENLSAWNNLGIFALHANQIPLAAEAFGRSAQLDPNNATSLWGRLVLMEIHGQADPAAPLLKQALAAHPADARIQQLAQRWSNPATINP